MVVAAAEAVALEVAAEAVVLEVAEEVASAVVVVAVSAEAEAVASAVVVEEIAVAVEVAVVVVEDVEPPLVIINLPTPEELLLSKERNFHSEKHLFNNRFVVPELLIEGVRA